MTPNEFDALLQQGYNRIPVVREVLADLDTPLSVYLKLVEGPYGFLFESVQGGEKWGRYSIIGLPCRTVLRVNDHRVTVTTDDERVESAEVDDPLAFVAEFKARYRVPELAGLPRFSGGLVGYFGYDTVSFIEPRLRNPGKPDPLGCPDILLMVADEVVVFDNLSGRMYLIVHADIDRGDTLADVEARLTLTQRSPDGLAELLRLDAVHRLTLAFTAVGTLPRPGTRKAYTHAPRRDETEKHPLLHRAQGRVHVHLQGLP